MDRIIEDYKQAVIDILKKDVRYEDNIPMLPVTKKAIAIEAIRECCEKWGLI